MPSRLVGESQAHSWDLHHVTVKTSAEASAGTTHPHQGQLAGEKRPGEEEKVTLGTHLLRPLMCALGLLERAQATTPPALRPGAKGNVFSMHSGYLRRRVEDDGSNRTEDESERDCNTS